MWHFLAVQKLICIETSKDIENVCFHKLWLRAKCPSGFGLGSFLASVANTSTSSKESWKSKLCFPYVFVCLCEFRKKCLFCYQSFIPFPATWRCRASRAEPSSTSSCSVRHRSRRRSDKKRLAVTWLPDAAGKDSDH